MKPKHIIIAAFFLRPFTGIAQPYNHQIPSYYTSDYNSQTVTTNAFNETVFISQNEASPNYGFDFDLAKVDVNGNYLLSTHVFLRHATLTPKSIITTLDNGSIVTGTYQGVVPAGYPFVPGGMVNATFYAKFDYNFNLVWFKLHYGYPIGQLNVVNEQIVPCGIIAVPNGVNEDYIFVNRTGGEDTITGLQAQRLEIEKLDFFGNLIKFVSPDVPSYFNFNSYPRISYLPVNGMCSITGSFFDALHSSFPSFLFTFDPGLTTIYKFSTYHSVAGCLAMSNVIEDLTDPANLLFSFQARLLPSAHGMTCYHASTISSVEVLKVKATDPGSLLQYQNYASSCMSQAQPPFTIKSIASSPTDVMIGFNQLSLTTSMTMPEFFNPALLRVRSVSTPVSYHLYNPSEHDDFLQYFENYSGDSFILHVNQYVDDSTQGTRIIKTDDMGRSFCTELPPIDTVRDSIWAVDSSYELVVDSVYLYNDTPILHTDGFETHPCDSAYGRFSNPNEVPANNIVTTTIFPVPASDELHILLGRDLKEINSIVVINEVGQMVLRRDYDAGDTDVTLDVSALKPGLYFITIFDHQGNNVKRTFVKM